MTPEEAFAHVKRMSYAVQKSRSNAFEMYDGAKEDAEEFFEMLYPWFFGEKCILRAVEVVIERGSVTGQEFFNLMYLVDKPENRAMLDVYFLAAGQEPLPEPDIAWVMEF